MDSEHSTSTNDEFRSLLASDRHHIAHASRDFLSKHIISPGSSAHRLRQFLQRFLTSKYGHYFVIVLVSLDVAGIFADFLITLHICEHQREDVSGWRKVDDALDTVSLVFSSLFVLELLLSIYAFGLRYFASKFHCLDAAAIIASFVVDVFLHGPLEEAGSLVIVLRLFRVFKIVEESSTVAEETLDELHERIEELEKENTTLRRRQGNNSSLDEP